MRQEMLYEHTNRPYLAAIASGESPCRDIAATSAPLSTSTRTQSAPPSCAATCSAVMRSLSVLFTFAPALRHYPSVYLPTPCVEKQDTSKLFDTTSPNVNRFSKLFLLADSVVNLQQTHISIFHHTLNMSLHYLVNIYVQNIAMLNK